MAQSMQQSTRAQRRNGAMRHNVRARANDVLDDFAELSKDVSRLADAAGKAARAEVTTAGKRVQGIRETLSVRARDGATYAVEQVRERPGTALGVSLGAGVLLGLLLARR